jgi:hypothetical protein
MLHLYVLQFAACVTGIMNIYSVTQDQTQTQNLLFTPKVRFIGSLHSGLDLKLHFVWNSLLCVEIPGNPHGKNYEYIFFFYWFIHSKVYCHSKQKNCPSCVWDSSQAAIPNNLKWWPQYWLTTYVHSLWITVTLRSRTQDHCDLQSLGHDIKAYWSLWP